MQQRLAPEASEDRFRKFSAELLAAEEVGFRGEFFYSPQALGKILERFCDIIADNLQVQSCTVQLKLYDSLNSPLIKQLLENEGRFRRSKKVEKPKGLGGDLQLLWNNFSSECQGRCHSAVTCKDAFGREQTDFRKTLLKNSFIFPYALYPKGALWLVASNKNGPWAKCAPWLISEINKGIMTQIVQDKAARVRDRMSIRQTRGHRKLGPIDPYIWTNQFAGNRRGPRYFFNYYGVPIRIHQGGDVIGILRIENKGLRDGANSLPNKHLRNVLRAPLGKTGDFDTLAGKLHERLCACKQDLSKQFELASISLLSLVYLAHDLASTRHEPNLRVKDLCTLPYYENDHARKHVNYSEFKRSDGNARPPVQITFDNSEEERAFVNWLSDKKTEEGRFDDVKKFYETLNTALSKPLTRSVNVHIRSALLDAINAVRKAEDGNSKTGLKPPHVTMKIVQPGSLLRAVQLEDPKNRFVFHVQVTPTHAELNEEKLKLWNLSSESARRYSRVNKQGFTHNYEDWQFHLETDRLAARIDALTFAFPIPKFTISDAWWLSWAALEIGKLIERQISYRGTNLSPTVPLTAMDFFRVPISDLSFVDALRDQYKAAEAVQNMLQYHIPNRCRELNLDAKLEHHYRIKDFRSYLERVGQGHRAHYDALISTWLYLLFLRLEDITADKLRDRLKDHASTSKYYLSKDLVGHFSNFEQCELLYEQAIALIDGLKAFKEAIEKICKDSKFTIFSNKTRDWFCKNADRILGDLKFSAPNMRLDKAKRKKAREWICENLSASPQAVSNVKPGVISKKDLREYIYRRYDPFVTQGISMYVTLSNTDAFQKDLTAGGPHGENSYETFYEQCRQLTSFLRRKFESSHQMHEQFRDASGDVAAKKRKELIEVLEKWRARAFSLSTTNFSSVLATSGFEPGTDEEHLTVRGIYKRIRTLVNIASNQVSPSLLNWETSRFDYVGARVNCLFKTQVFAIYEHLWNRGDPFSHWTTSKPKGGPPHPASKLSRQRWLSIRTKVHRGEDGYNAWQLVALMDPEAFRKGHADRIYSINAVRNYLVRAFDEWHPEEADVYRDKAEERNRWQEDYCKWFRNIRNILRGERPRKSKERDIYFPDYLLRTPCDIFIRLLETQEAKKEDFTVILDLLHKFIRVCEPSKRGVDPSRLWTSAQKIYEKAEWLAKVHRSDAELVNALSGQLPVLKKERERFEKLLEKDGKDAAKWPDTRAFGDKVFRSRIEELQSILSSKAKADEIWRKALQHLLIGVQGMQKQYLFDMGKYRETSNVLDMILCYVLLYPPPKGDKGKSKRWYAYDLFYYLMSLVPVEIQIRTALANTMAEQYHGLYKSSAAATSDVAVQQWRLQKIGRKLDDVDRETEAQYDEYIDHSILYEKADADRDDEQNGR